jgi:hypothetical protein
VTGPPALSPEDRRLAERFLQLLELLDERDACRLDPARLISHMSAPDERTAETFGFTHLRALAEAPGDHGWLWQREIIEWFHGEQRCIALKARQLGITWLSCAYVLWTCLCKPGSLSLVYRQKEEEAVENVRRCWALFESLPAHLRMDVEILTPQRGALPSTEIKFRFPSGAISRIAAMSSASASGHGKTAAVVLLDEFSRIERAADIMKAVQPAAGSKGKILIISTANGRSNPDTGDGNQFHYLWTHADEAGFSKRFLPWSLHPDRDQAWYDHDPEVRGLKSHERAEQYPANEHEAFTLTNRVFFDPEDLAWYAENAKSPGSRFDFDIDDLLRAKRREHDRGNIRLYEAPVAERDYAIGADVATGRGQDYSCAYVVDLATMELVAELHARLDSDLYATQLHYLGRWYNSALIAVETAGGFGEAVIIPLRDGRAGRPPYPRLYRHVLSSRPDLPVSKPFGFPTNVKTRPLIVNGLDKAVRDRAMPWLPGDLVHEMGDFVYHDHGTSPAAQTGCHDDRVMAAAIALEMYRLHGHHPELEKRRAARTRRERWVARPWQKAA